MKVIIYALAAVLAVPSTLGQHHTHTRRLGVVNEQAAMSIDMITDAMSMQSTAAVEPNDGPVYPVFGKSGKSGSHGGPTPITSGKSGRGKSGPTAPSDGGSKSSKSATTTQATSPGTTGGTTSGTDPTTPDTTVMTSSGTTSGTDPTTPDTTVMTTDATTPGTPTPPDTTVMTTDATTPGTPTPPDTTVMTTSPPPAAECTLTDTDPFSDCPPNQGNMRSRFCCTRTNPDTNQGPTQCVTNISGEPCGPGPAQLDMCTEPPGGSADEGRTPCDPDTQQCCKDANTNQEFCCLPDLEPVGLTCLSIPSGYCDLPEVFRDNGLAVFLLGLILQALGLFDGNRRNLRSVVDEQGIQDIMAKLTSLLNEEEGGMEGIMAKVSELGVDADMMNQLANVIGN